MRAWSPFPLRPTSGKIVAMRKDPAKQHTVAVVIANGQSPFEFAVACEVFGFARDFGVPWYRFLVVAADPPPVRAQTGFTISTEHGIEALAEADTIIIPVRQEPPPAALLDALRVAHARGARLMSLCNGAFTLAAAGLLDGRRATTHWAHTTELARRYPAIDVDPDVLYIHEGDILTSAGTAAGIDLCLHVVRRDYGAAIANEVARDMVVAPHRDGGQAQFVCAPVPPTPMPDLFSETLTWLQEHLDEPLTVELLASRAAMSARTFARHFVDVTGTTPHQWLLRQRVLFARRLLETTDLGIDAVAERSGLGSAANLRQHFRRVLRTSPGAYRRTFQTVS